MKERQEHEDAQEGGGVDDDDEETRGRGRVGLIVRREQVLIGLPCRVSLGLPHSILSEEKPTLTSLLFSRHLLQFG